MAKKSVSKTLHNTVKKSKRPSVREALNGATVGGDSLPERRTRKKVVNPKTRKLIGVLIDDPDLTLKKAGKKAGWKNNPAQNAYQALKSQSAQELFRREMSKRKGLQHSALAEKLEQGLGAMTTKLFAHEGQIIDERDLVDYGARHAYLALAARLAGIDPTNKVDVTTNGKDINSPHAVPLVVLPQLTTDQLLALLTVPEPADVIAAPVEPEPPVEEKLGADGAA